STGTSAPVRSASRTPSPTPDAGVRYTVRPGDALELIAGQYGVSSAAIVEENDLVPPYILEVGQVLVIPTEQ
ncbi:MAG: LysM peptidoglycan-binding domain-containing protein, partial [Dehalococcoidia bacterium]|nr:LysM peptidoglycan-binding domain-containing protein [Dehalococcoidia bacterium]